MSDMINVSICDGKYTIIQDASGRTKLLRHGEPWRWVTGDDVILGAAYEIEKLQERIKQLEDNRTMAAANSLANMLSYEDAVAKIKRLEEAAQRVDDAAHSIQDWSGTVLGDALDELNNAKEDKGGGIASREQLPYMSDEQLNRFASIYRSKEDGIQVVGLPHAKVYENNPDWEHLATLDSFRWIQCLLNNSPRERNKQIKEITG